MSRPVMLVDNLLNRRIYAGHVLTASSTAAGTNVLNLPTGRRRKGINFGGWFGGALDTDTYVQIVFDRLRGVNALFIDRDHNLDGQSIRVRLSDDDFTTETVVGPKTVPSDPTPFAALFDGEIVRTDEGALLWWLGDHAAHEVRVQVDAMGTGLRPELAGMMLGQAYTSNWPAVKPTDFGRPNLVRTSQRTPLGQSGSSQVGRWSSGVLRLRMDSYSEYTIARYHLEELYLAGKPMVLMHSDGAAERARLVQAPAGQAGFEWPNDAYLPEIPLPWEELEPVLL